MRTRTRTAPAYVTGGPQSAGRTQRENELADLPSQIESLKARARAELWRLTYACDDPVARQEIPSIRELLSTPTEQMLAEITAIREMPADQWRNKSWTRLRGGDRLDLCDDSDGG